LGQFLVDSLQLSVAGPNNQF